MIYKECWLYHYDIIYLLTAIGLSPGNRSTVHNYTQTMHRTTKKFILVTINGEELARDVCRRTKNSINSDGKARKVKEVINNIDNNIFK